MRILLVEDDKAIADGLVFCLKREEFQVFCAYNGDDALTLFSQNHFDMLILDIGLPDINGLKLYKKLKEVKDIPTIFLTANDSELSVVEALDSGADDYVTKPFKMRELISRIHSVLRRLHKEEDVIKFQDITIYPKEYFTCPYRGQNGGYSIHYFAGSWIKKSKIKKFLIKFIKILIGQDRYLILARKRAVKKSNYYEKYLKDKE